jgi:hypothetical protein
MRKVNLNSLVAVLLITGVVLLEGRFRHHESSTPDRDPTSVPVAAVSKIAEPPSATAAATATAAVVPIVPAPLKLEKKPEPFATELAEYAVLKKKVFLTAAEESQRNSFLKNDKILRGMRSRLLSSPTTAKEAKEQNAAIDLLLDAVRIGDSEVAVEVLRDVVADGQIEDENIDRATRENLAGVKAEVLYQWSALKPAQAQELANMLPGPVSQKIWQNVVSAQASNLSESAALAH